MTAPNPPIDGVRCGRDNCGAEIYRVETGIGGEFICTEGHVIGVWIDKGELPIGPAVALDGHPLNAAGRDPRDPMNPWPKTRPADVE